MRAVADGALHSVWSKTQHRKDRKESLAAQWAKYGQSSDEEGVPAATDDESEELADEVQLAEPDPAADEELFSDLQTPGSPEPLPPPEEEPEPLAAAPLEAVPAGAASSSGGPRRGSARDGEITSLAIPGLGKIVYYESSGFYAYCGCPLHNQEPAGDGLAARKELPCRKTRIGKAAKGRKGRPLGFLMAWLQEQVFHEHKEDHQAAFFGDLDQRREARQALHEVPGSEALFAQERLRTERGGNLEDSEPEAQP